LILRKNTLSKHLPVLRRCISCRKIYDRKDLLKITKNHNQEITIEKENGRSAYLCKTKKCSRDPKIQKKLQKSLKIFINQDFYELFEMEIQNYK